MTKLIMALDQGTTSSRCILYDAHCRMISEAHEEYPQHYPHPGWVEHDPMDIWNSQLHAMVDAMNQAHVTAADIACIGITNQRETTICWDALTGRPVYRAIVWQCRRTADFCRTWKETGGESLIRERTGLLLDPYFSGTKLKWILDHVPEAMDLAQAGRLRFGTVDTWLIWQLSGGKRHVTDYTNASRTMLFNIHTLKWDETILDALHIPASVLPEVLPCSGLFAVTSYDVMGAEIPICGVAGDQQAALFGQLCLARGQGKMTFGTGGFMLMNTGEKPAASKNGLLTTIAWNYGGKTTYALEGSMFMSGAVVQWLRDELKIIDTAQETEAMAQAAGGNGGVYLVPAFVGIGAPYWRPDARAAILGLSRGSSKNHIARAALECQVYQTMDVLAAMNEDMGTPAEMIRVDGGACANGFMMQFLADITGLPVERPAIIETTSLGAAQLAGLAAGIWEDEAALAAARHEGTHFVPDMPPEEREGLMENWHKAVHCALAFTQDDAQDDEA